MNILKFKFFKRFFAASLFLSSVFLSVPAQATDSGDLLFHLVGAWNQDLEVFQTRADIGYSFWDDFSIGPVFEYNEYFYTPALGITWHLEPFEILVHSGPLFWRKSGISKNSYQVSIHANYMMQITTHFQFLVTAGVNLPERFFRGVPIGAGFRYWF